MTESRYDFRRICMCKKGPTLKNHCISVKGVKSKACSTLSELIKFTEQIRNCMIRKAQWHVYGRVQDILSFYLMLPINFKYDEYCKKSRHNKTVASAFRLHLFQTVDVLYCFQQWHLGNCLFIVSWSVVSVFDSNDIKVLHIVTYGYHLYSYTYLVIWQYTAVWPQMPRCWGQLKTGRPGPDTHCCCCVPWCSSGRHTPLGTVWWYCWEEAPHHQPPPAPGWRTPGLCPG